MTFESWWNELVENKTIPNDGITKEVAFAAYRWGREACAQLCHDLAFSREGSNHVRAAAYLKARDAIRGMGTMDVDAVEPTEEANQ